MLKSPFIGCWLGGLIVNSLLSFFWVLILWWIIQDGRVICSSLPIYGEGKEPGNEAGYIVGMSTCYPQPGSVKISNGETLTVKSYYSSEQGHTGVMGLFYILVADSDSSAKLNSSQHAPVGVWVYSVFLTSFLINQFGLKLTLIVLICADT